MLIIYTPPLRPITKYFEKTNSNIKIYYGNLLGAKNEKWPEDSLFGFYYADYKDGKLRIAIDHIGNKSLYFAIVDNSLFVSNSIAEILSESSSFSTIVVDKTKLRELLISRYNIGEDTLIKGIKYIEPVYEYVFEFDNSFKIIKKRKFSFGFEEDFCIAKEKKVIENISSKMNNIIESAGSFPAARIANALTGGVDSSFIQNIINKFWGNNIYSYSLSFKEDPKFHAEIEYALTASRLFGTNHHLFDLDKRNFFEILKNTIIQNEYPLILYHTAPYSWCTSNLPADIDIIFSGYGADLQFGESLRKFWFAKNFPNPLNIFNYLLDKTSSINFNNEKISHYLHQLPKHLDLVKNKDYFIENISHIDSPIELGIIKDIFGDSLSDKLWSYKQNFVLSSDPRDIIDAAYALSYLSMTATISSWSRLTNVINKQLLFPFASVKIFELSRKIKPELKLKMYGLRQKYLLKQAALNDGIPKWLVYRSKRTGELPVRRWIINGDFDDYFELDTLNQLDIDIQAVKNFIKTGHKNVDFILWSAANFSIWVNYFLKKFGNVKIES